MPKHEPSPTGTYERYRLSASNLVAQQMGVGINSDGTTQSIPNNNVELVFVHQIFPDTMQALVTYRDSMVDNGQQNDTRTVMLLSPMVGDNCKLLILPPGTDIVENGQNIRIPSQTDLTGLCVNLNGSAENGSVLIGYVRMIDEEPVPVEADVFLKYGNSLFKITNDYIEFDNLTTSIKITNEDVKVINGESTVDISNEAITLTSPTVTIKGNTTINGQIIGNPSGG